MINEVLFGTAALVVTVKNRSQILYVSYDRSVLRISLLVRRLIPRIRIVMRMAGLAWYQLARNDRIARWFYIYAFRQVNSVNFISRGLEQMVQAHALRLGSQIEFRHSFVSDIGIDLPALKRNHFDDLPESPFVLVMPARFSSYQKRQDLLVEAFRLLPRSCDCRLVFIGEGDRKSLLQDLVVSYGLADRVKFLPFQNQIALFNYLKRVHLLAVATEYEGLGKIILESMSLGLPPLVSDVEPLNQYISDNNTGFLCANTPEAWAERIQQLRFNRTLLRHISTNVKEFTRKNFDSITNVGFYESAFIEVLEEK